MSDYDQIYRKSAEYRKPYRESFYYPLWQQVFKLLPADKRVKILEIGCGSGQFAAMLREAGYHKYTGIDISAKAVELAQGCGQVVQCADTFDYLKDHVGYDVVIALETLEHLDDRALLRWVKPGATVILSVPNFPNKRHLRYFASSGRVRQHYSDLLDFFHVGIGMTCKDQVWFVGRAVRRFKAAAIMPLWNEIQYLPLKLAWCRRQGLAVYAVDNYSDDGTWEYLQAHGIPSHRVDTGGAFHILRLQEDMPGILRRMGADWAVYQSADLYFEADRPLVEEMWRADAEGYNLIEMRVAGMFNTGERPGRFDPFNTFYRMKLGKYVTMINRVAGLVRYNADGVVMEERKVKRIPGLVINMGMTKPARQREATYQRRVRAWQQGLRSGVGKHYEPSRARDWVWPAESTVDIRQTAWWNYYQRLGSLK